MTTSVLAAFLTVTALVAPDEAPDTGWQGRYRVLSCSPHTAPPFEAVDILYGPRETVDGHSFCSWQLTIRPHEGADPPLCRVRVVSSRDPLADSSEPLRIIRYQLHIPETKETYDYQNVNTGHALLPPWKDFMGTFIPRRARGSASQQGLAHSAQYLGHVLTLRGVDKGVGWEEWADVKTLTLDPELLIGTGRDFKDKEGHRLPQVPERQDYTYVRFTPEDYRFMIDTGVNLFTIAAHNEHLVRGEPVFYHRHAQGKPLLRYPADLYRGNYLGATMFMDEPTSILTGDEHINTVLKYWSDFAVVIRGRVHSRYMGSKHYGAFQLEAQLAKQGVNFGDMQLMQYDYPSWETVLETTYYQMAGGCNGLVHEGRYNLAAFTDDMNRWLGEQREYTPEQYLRFQYAMLRGGTRPFGKYWGTAIYGQCAPELSPLAVTLAYDMGARYVWYWTSDHEHHLPWPEQMELTRHLRKHVAERPRRSIEEALPVRDLAIALPYGYFLWLGNESSNKHANLWWMRELDVLTHQNEPSKRFHRLMKKAVRAIVDAFERDDDFDIVIDDGREFAGYQRIIRLTDE